MWLFILGVLFLFWCIGTFMESYHAAGGGRKTVQLKHQCFPYPGTDRCAICERKLK